MKKACVLLLLLVFLVGCQTINGIFSPQKESEPIITPEVEDKIPSEVLVSMKDGVFDKPEVTIKKGGTVTWKNDDVKPYAFTIYSTIEDERSKTTTKTQSGQIGTDQEFKHTFETTGEHKIIPLWYGSLRGMVIVIQ